MNIELYISGNVVEKNPVYIHDWDNFLQKRKKVELMVTRLKHKYRFLLEETDWEIVLTEKSRDVSEES